MTEQIKRKNRSIDKEEQFIEEDEGIVRFLASTNSMDSHQDRVNQDGWQFRDHIPVLWAHSEGADDPPAIGKVVDHDVTTRGLELEIQFDLEDELGKKVFRKVKEGFLGQGSVGFEPIDSEPLENGRKRFIRQKLVEFSITNVGSNPDTRPLEVRDMPDFPTPPESVRQACELGLEWAEEGFGGDGLDESTIDWAEKMANGTPPTKDKALKMGSWFSRHLSQDHPMRDEEGDPTPHAVSVKLWGGEEAGPSYTRRLYRIMDREIPETLQNLEHIGAQTKAEPGELEVGDFVRWDSAGGEAQGEIEEIVRDGEIDVPNADVTVEGTEDDPAALIRIFQEREDGWEATDKMVGHRFSTLRKIDDLKHHTQTIQTITTKEGKVLSQENKSLIEDARDALDEILDKTADSSTKAETKPYDGTDDPELLEDFPALEDFSEEEREEWLAVFEDVLNEDESNEGEAAAAAFAAVEGAEEMAFKLEAGLEEYPEGAADVLEDKLDEVPWEMDLDEWKKLYLEEEKRMNIDMLVEAYPELEDEDPQDLAELRDEVNEAIEEIVAGFLEEDPEEEDEKEVEVIIPKGWDADEFEWE